MEEGQDQYVSFEDDATTHQHSNNLSKNASHIKLGLSKGKTSYTLLLGI